MIMFFKKASRRFSLDVKIPKMLFRCECTLQRNSKERKECSIETRKQNNTN